MTPAMEQMRIQLAQIIETAAAEAEARRLEEQRQAAEAIEHANSSAALAAAYSQGRHDEQRRTLALIDEHRSLLKRGGLNAISLSTLANIIQGRHPA